MVCAIIGFLTGVIINYFIIKPIERKKIREECIRGGLVPRELVDHFEWRKNNFFVGDVVQTVDGLDRGLVVLVDKDNMPKKVMASPGGFNNSEPRYYGGVKHVQWYKTGEIMTQNEWMDKYSTQHGWEQYCIDSQAQKCFELSKA